MIRLIAAMDDQRGIATDSGLPWRLPGDTAYFHECTKQGLIVMGWVTYSEFKAPLHDRENFVLSSQDGPLREGFTAIGNLKEFLIGNNNELVWVIGGAAVFAAAIGRADELFITQVLANFNCSKFFPEYAQSFSLTSQSELHEENQLTYQFERWQRSDPTSEA